VVTEKKLAERAHKLRDAMEKESLYSFAEGKIAASETDTEGWKALFNLFNATSRDELVTLLGFSKSEVATRVAEAIENVQLTKTSGEQVSKQRIHEPVVSFAEPIRIPVCQIQLLTSRHLKSLSQPILCQNPKVRPSPSCYESS